MIYQVALTLIERIGPRTATTLVELMGSAEVVFNAPAPQLKELDVTDRIIQTLISGKEQALTRANSIIELCQRSGIRILTKNMPHYPQLLRECPDAPMALYVRGGIDFNIGRWISIVGTRKATQLGMSQTREAVQGIAVSFSDAVIVSGLAFGIDKAAHNAAIEQQLPTVAVMPGWVDDIAPRSHYGVARSILASKGAIVSDMPPGTVIVGRNFLSRNRIIAGLSHLTMVIESAAKGGSLVTADIALSYNREVFALPGRVDDAESHGTNMLIRSSKAHLYQDAGDLAEVMDWSRANITPQNPAILPEYLSAVLHILPDTDPFTLEQICEELNIPVGDASSRVIQLEVRGFIKSLQGRLYQKAKY